MPYLIIKKNKIINNTMNNYLENNPTSKVFYVHTQK